MSYHLSWTRPVNVPFPNVWLRFKAKDTESDKLVEYRIQDLPEDRFEDAIQHMTDNYLVDEPIAKSLGCVQGDPELRADFERIIRAVLPQRMAVVCVIE